MDKNQLLNAAEGLLKSYLDGGDGSSMHNRAVDQCINLINELDEPEAIPEGYVLMPMAAIVSAQTERKEAMIDWEAGTGSDQSALFELDRILVAMLTAHKGTNENE